MSSSLKNIRVAVIDDHPIVGEALSDLFHREPGFQLDSLSHQTEAGLRACLMSGPDVVIMDVDVPGRGSFAVAEEIVRRLPSTQVVFFSGFWSDIFIEEALRVGARGYVLKADSAADLILGIRQVCDGGWYFSAPIADRLEYNRSNKQFRVRASSFLATLTTRQLTVLRHLARGASVKEVAKLMVLTERAIESHKYRIMQKLGIHDRVELARYAIREGLMMP